MTHTELTELKKGKYYKRLPKRAKFLIEKLANLLSRALNLYYAKKIAKVEEQLSKYM